MKLNTQVININKITPASYNPRVELKPGDAEYENLKKSIDRFGYLEPIVWNSRSGNIVGGHQRFNILKEKGSHEFEVSVVDLNDEEEKALNLALNKISGHWDEDKLVSLLEELQQSDLSEFTGFNLDEMNEIIENYSLDKELENIDEIVDDEFDLDEALEKARENTITRPGDIWLLGEHRLMCGDSTNLEQIKKLMDGRTADMIFTDPPYNVNYEGATKDKLKIANDHMSDEAFYHFLLAAYNNMSAVTKPGGAIYVCHADTETENFRKTMKEAGFLLKQCLIWSKNTFVLGRQDYHWQHEPILYGWKDGAAHYWKGGRIQTTIIEDSNVLSIVQEKDHVLLTIKDGDKSIVLKAPSYEMVESIGEEASTIWRIDKPNRNGIHPTMKPVPIPARALINSSKPQETVLDPFGGGGSTLMAAEETGRLCCTMEYDPIYCDAIVERYETHTGKKAKRITT
jgi:DNA modification methylase